MAPDDDEMTFDLETAQDDDEFYMKVKKKSKFALQKIFFYSCK